MIKEVTGNAYSRQLALNSFFSLFHPFSIRICALIKGQRINFPSLQAACSEASICMARAGYAEYGSTFVAWWRDSVSFSTPSSIVKVYATRQNSMERNTQKRKNRDARRL